jgi:probable blue pigment (indigoidine) exporter
MTRIADLFLTGLAAVIWGTVYLVTTRWLPEGYPLTISLIRALPAGLLLLAFVHELPKGVWLFRVLVLGGLNFSLFWWLIFVSAYRLPGGVAATVNAVQPVFVVGLSWLLLGAPLRWAAVGAALGGVVGVALLVVQPAPRSTRLASRLPSAARRRWRSAPCSQNAGSRLFRR